MMKKQKLVMGIIIAVLLIFAYQYGYLDGVFSALGLYDDYMIYDDFNDGITGPTDISTGKTMCDINCNCEGGPTSAENDKFYMFTEGWSLPAITESGGLLPIPTTITSTQYSSYQRPVSLYIKEDFKGKDIKLELADIAEGDARGGIAFASGLTTPTTGECGGITIAQPINNMPIGTLDGSKTMYLTMDPLNESVIYFNYHDVESTIIWPYDELHIIISSGIGSCLQTCDWRYFYLPNIDTIKYKYPYSCEVGNDEIMMFDDFANGTTFNIGDLTYTPTKFCIDYPVIFRNFEDEGIRLDYKYTVFEKFVSGDSITLPDDISARVTYITKFSTESMPQRCDFTQGLFYNPQTQECEGLLDPVIQFVYVNGTTNITIINDTQYIYINQTVYFNNASATARYIDRLVSNEHFWPIIILVAVILALYLIFERGSHKGIVTKKKGKTKWRIGKK